MKIFIFLTQDLESPSGLGRFFPLAKELAKLDYQVKIYSLHSNYFSLKNKKETIDRVEVIYLGQMQVLKIGNEKKYYKPIYFMYLMTIATIKFLFYALSGDYDLVYVGKPHPMNGIAGLIGKIIRKKMLIIDCDDLESSSNNFQNKWQQSIVNFFEKKLPLYANKVVTNTFFFKDKLIKAGVCEENIYLLPNGIDLDRFEEDQSFEAGKLKKQLGLSKKRIIGYIGTISVISHPIEILLDAFVILKTQIDNIHLLIVGAGEDLLYIQNKIKELEINDSVTMVGRINSRNISNYYKVCDISVDPVYDNNVAKARLPLKMFESWVVGVPFVTSDVGDRKFYLHSPISGIVAKGDLANDLANAIYLGLTDLELRKMIIQNGLIKSKKYSWNVLTKNFSDFLKGKMNNG